MPKLTRKQQALADALRSFGVDSAVMSLSEFDGLAAGLAVLPELIRPSEWLPLVWGAADDEDAAVFESEAHIQQVSSLLFDHYNAVINDLHRGEGCYSPLYDVFERTGEVLWEIWISGFEAAMKLRPDAIVQVLDGSDDETAACWSMMAALCLIAEDASDLSAEANEALTEEAPDIIPRVVEGLYAARLAAPGGAPAAGGPRGAKVGRNDPCPCGSGKKYKKCCGAQ